MAYAHYGGRCFEQNCMRDNLLVLCCVQPATGSLTDAAANGKDSSSPWFHSPDHAQSQDRMSVRVPSPSPFSSFEPVTAFQAAGSGGKLSPPPFARSGPPRQDGHRRQGSISRMPSLAGGNQRKRQLSFSSLNLDTLDSTHSSQQ